MAAAIQQRLETEVREFRGLQKQQSTLENSRAQYLTQQNENQLVLSELELVEPEADVYKLIGPALMKQQKSEAVSNVKKRLEFINSELKKLDDTHKDIEKKQGEKRAKILELQEQLQKVAPK